MCLCMFGIADIAILAVFAFVILNFSFFLSFIFFWGGGHMLCIFVFYTCCMVEQGPKGLCEILETKPKANRPKVCLRKISPNILFIPFSGKCWILENKRLIVRFIPAPVEGFNLWVKQKDPKGLKTWFEGKGTRSTQWVSGSQTSCDRLRYRGRGRNRPHNVSTSVWSSVLGEIP